MIEHMNGKGDRMTGLCVTVHKTSPSGNVNHQQTMCHLGFESFWSTGDQFLLCSGVEGRHEYDRDQVNQP